MKCYRHTPLKSKKLDGNRQIWFKMDCQQPSHSFKLRGMDHLVRHCLAKGQGHFIASSGGNAGYSLAFASRVHGGKTKVVVPEATPEAVCQMIRDQGAELICHGKIWAEADQLARQMVAEENAVYVSPFDNPLLWEGHSTMIDEICEDLAAQGLTFPAKLVCAVGGGGMLIGIMQGLERNGCLDQVEVVAAETEGAASYAKALEKGAWIGIDSIDTVASSLGALKVAKEAWEWSKKANISSFVMSDVEAVRAVQAFASDFGVEVEPACGAALAYVYGNENKVEDTLVIACGGIGWGNKESEDFLEKYN